MKTNQILTRKMGDFSVFQRTSDGKFNATELLKQWNGFSGQHKQMIHYSDNNSTKEFIEALVLEENLKERNSVLLQNRGKNGGTWMHPLLFIDFAMWLNPTFKVKVLKFVYDELIKYRNEAGDTYNDMCRVVNPLIRGDRREAFRKLGEAINCVVYERSEKQMRNKVGDESKMRELVELEKNIILLVDNGFITSFPKLIEYLRCEWTKRWDKNPIKRIA